MDTPGQHIVIEWDWLADGQVSAAGRHDFADYGSYVGGVALAETLRERWPDLPVVLASGYSHVLAREDDHGFDLLHKPYSVEQLARALRRVMAKRGAASVRAADA